MSIVAHDPRYKKISPYDLTSGDNPGAVISQPLLNGLNYDEWALNFRMALSSRKKFGFLDGSIPKPAAGDATLEDWTANNHLLVGWIKLTIEPKLRSSISTREVARDLWDIIKKRFSLKSGARLQQLRNSLATCKQNGSTVDDYFGRLTKIWDGIAECMNTKQCSCGKCECDLNTAHDNEREILRVHDFLSGLDDSTHGVVRSQLCAITPLPDLDSIYQTIVQNETLRMNATPDVAVMGFAAQASRPNQVWTRDVPRQSSDQKNAIGFGSNNRDPTRQCTACGKSGHEASACFKIIGYPDWWPHKPQNYFGAKGPQVSAMGRGRGSTPRVNSTQITSVNSAAVNSSPLLTDSDRQGLSGLSDDQWRLVQQLINAGKSSSSTGGKQNDDVWILDTGATHHMTGRLDLMDSVSTIAPLSVLLPADSDACASKQGIVRLTPRLHLQNVFYVEGFHMNLISFGQLVTDNFLVGQVTDKLMILQDRITRMLIGAGEREGEGLYRFRGIDMVAVFQTSVRPDMSLWHKRLGHPSSSVTGIVSGVSCSSRSSDELSLKSCDVCLRAKQTRQCFPDSLNNAKVIFDLIHLDLWGPYRTTAFCGSRYFLTIVDDHSRAVWLYLLSDKTMVQQQLREFLAMIERQFGKKVKTIRSDNGTEFLCMTRFFREQGIVHETSCVHTPQQNGRVERKHRHILNVARALRFQAHLPIEYWGECILTAGYLINRTPSVLLKNKTPFEMLYGHAPGYKHIRVFGCLAYAHNLDHKGDKFASRSRRCMFLGYPYGKKGWKLYDLEREIVFTSCDVVFQEDSFPFAVITSQENEVPTSVPSPTLPSLENDVVHDSAADIEINPVEEENNDVNEQAEPVIPIEDGLGRGRRSKQPSVRLRDYVVETISGTAPSSSLVSVSPTPQPSSGTVYPMANFVSCVRFSPNHRRFLMALTVNMEPRSFFEAMKDERWGKAVDVELDSLIALNTWRFEHLPPGKKALGNHWVFTIKYQSDGTIERYKARLVAQGNHQTEGLDYTDTFAPVAMMKTVRFFLDFAAKNNHEVHQMDVHNAFLHGDLHEEVYMKIPQGLRVADGETRVLRLQKSLYGLKQAPRCWFEKLRESLLNYGFTQTKSDYSLFVYLKNGVSLRILVYVDDLIISGNSLEAIKSFKSYLSLCFKMKDLGVVKYFLGLEVARSPAGFYLCQRKYALDIVEDMGLSACKPAGFPIDQNHKLSLADGPSLADPEVYRRLVGRLVYLAATRPDLTYAIHVLSQFMKSPREDHWLAALKVVRYLKGTIGQGILLRAESSMHFSGWCDSDYAACPLSRRSLTGYIVQFGSSPIVWKTRKQDTVCRSSAEAEYRAMTEVTCELRWLKGLLTEMGVDHTEPMTLLCDSKPALHIAANPVFHERTKHVEVDCHFIRDDIVRGLIKTKHVPTEEQLAIYLLRRLARRSSMHFFSSWA